MTPEQIKTRIDELQAHRENVATQGAKAETLVRKCQAEYAGVSGAIQELERLLTEMSKEVAK